MRRFRIVRDIVKVDKRDALRLAFEQGLVDTNTELEGNSLLHYVSREGSEDCLRYLLEEAFHEFPYKSLNKDRNTILHWAVRREWMRANRRQSLAELCNPKLIRLAQVPHRTADREDPKLARRKWQPPHNMGEPQTENTLDNTFKHRNCTNGQILRSGSKLIEAGDYTSI